MFTITQPTFVSALTLHWRGPEAPRGVLGGFNWSSQHLHAEVGEWGDHEDGRLRG